MAEERPVLLVDDDGGFRSTLADILELEGFGTLTAGSRDEAAALVAGGRRPGAAVIDVQLPDGRGTELAQELRLQYPELPVVMVTGHGSMETAVEAMRAGTLDYMTKPVRPPALLELLRKALDRNEQRDEEARLRAREERYRSLFDESPAAHGVFDGYGHIITCNRAFGQLLGYESAEEAANATITDHLDRCELKSVARRLTRRDIVRGLELEMRARDGRRIFVHSTLHAVRDDSGRVREVRAYVVDLTHRVELEQRLREAERMKAVGQLAGGIAHEFQNLLTVILANAELMDEVEGDGSDAAEELQGIRKAAGRAAALTQQLLLFGQRDISRDAVVDLAAAVSLGSSLVRELARPDIKASFDLEGPGHVILDPGVLDLVLANLTRNAADAMPEGGELRVVVRRERIDAEQRLADWISVPALGDYVVLTVEDTGTGIAPEDEPRIFEPFFSTKPEGTGLGLAAVFGAVTKGGGGLRVEGRPGEGARISVAWPEVKA